MDIDPMQIGTHAGSGFVGTILAFFGFNKKIERIQSEIDTLKEKVVYDDTCKMCQRNNENQFKSVHDKLDILIQRER